MRIAILPGPEEVAARAAHVLVELVALLPAAVLALPTGRTPQKLYAELVRRQRSGELDLGSVTVFQLDEFLGLGADDPRSFRAALRRELLDAVNLRPDQLVALDGASADPAAECERYEQRIHAAGGIDLVVLGVGADGHIGFNEPGSSLGSRTRLKTLTRETRRANLAAFARQEDVPRVALTMGVGTILAARRCLLLATGAPKAAIIARAIEGPITAQVTASALQLHPRVTVLLDEAAAAELERADYYRETEAAQQSFEAKGFPSGGDRD
jgi:glucosamine-6-phosphate deaminase